MQSQNRAGFTYAFTGAPTNDLSGNGYRAPRVARLRPEPAEQRADVRPSVPHRVRRARRRAERPVLHGYLDQRRVPSAGVHQPRHHVLQELRFGQRSLQFRAELYNAFNTTQYQDVDTSAVFDYATGQQTDTNFGRITGVRPATNRIIQLGIRFRF